MLGYIVLQLTNKNLDLSGHEGGPGHCFVTKDETQTIFTFLKLTSH